MTLLQIDSNMMLGADKQECHAITQQNNAQTCEQARHLPAGEIARVDLGAQGE
jgi:hypothetical protein